MQSSCVGDASSSQGCYQGCCVRPFLGLLPPQSAARTFVTSAAASRYTFEVAMASCISPDGPFTNHESLPSLREAFAGFVRTFPQYSQLDQADRIRDEEYCHLSQSKHVCLDYVGQGLFSYSQHISHYSRGASYGSTSSSLDLPPFFDISYKSVSLNSLVQFGGQESEMELKIHKRIMDFMNISEEDYTMVFTANQSCAFKLLTEAYPFHFNQNLLTVYDYESEAVNLMIESSKKKGARVMSAEFLWPTLRIHSRNLQKKIVNKRKVKKSKKRKRGLFVFPLQSRMTGTRYSYLWMSLAQENGWHVLFDACALGPKDMETLGLSLFKPDFLICSFFKVFDEDPSGFGCLFVKKSVVPVLKDSTTATNTGIVRLVPAMKPSQRSGDSSFGHELHNENISEGSSSGPIQSEHHEAEDVINKQQETTEIEELETPFGSSTRTTTAPASGSVSGKPEVECRGLDHADSLGLVLMSSRARYLINWLVNALMSLQHPHSENGIPPVRIYGPKVKFDRGPAVAFNVFDWKGEKINPAIVQKLADRNNISLSCGFLNHIWFSDKNEEERERVAETRTSEGAGTVLNERKDSPSSGISVVTAFLGFLTNFEDIYRLWAFVSRFLDADFVEKERWRYTALNQKTVEV